MNGIVHRASGMAAGLALILVTASAVSGESLEPSALEPSAMERLLNAPAVEHPLVFGWGVAYGAVARNLKEAQVIEARPDRELRFTKSGVEYHYSFFQRRGAMLTVPPEPDPKGAPAGGGADGSGPGVLFAVTILLPGMALQGENGRALVRMLEVGYGRATNQTAGYFDLESESTTVRVYLENYRRVRYVRRLTFVSKRLATERNRQYQGAIRVGEVGVTTPTRPLWDFSRSDVVTSVNGR